MQPWSGAWRPPVQPMNRRHRSLDDDDGSNGDHDQREEGENGHPFSLSVSRFATGDPWFRIGF